MAKTFRPAVSDKVANAVLGFLLRVGVGPGFMRLLTVTGRRTGRPRTTPVVPVQTERGWWLVSPYGDVGWVRNARASGCVTLRRGRTSETLAATEVAPAAAVPVLREYLARRPIRKRVQPYFDVTPQSSDDEFEADASHHPVFELRPLAA